MSTHRSPQKTAAPQYPDAVPVGEHLVIDRTEWVPGRHPESHLGRTGQAGYVESYYRCLRCGAERQSERDLPAECDPDPKPSYRPDG